MADRNSTHSTLRERIAERGNVRRGRSTASFQRLNSKNCKR